MSRMEGIFRLALLAASTLCIQAAFATAALAAPGLVLAFGFEEGSGSTTADASGNRNTGSISGGAWNGAGRFGRALSFDGATSQVDVSDSSSLDLTSGLTLEAWVNPASRGGYRTVVLKEVPGELAYALYSNDDSDRPGAWIRIGSVSSDASGAGPVPLNRWTHLAAAYDGSALKLYVNGVEAASRRLSGSMAVSSSPLRIGGNAVWGERFQGLIDEVRVYDRALGPDEILTDMTTPIAASAVPTPLAIVFPGDGATVSGTVLVSAIPSSGAQPAGIQFLLDGAGLGDEDPSPPYSVSWDTQAAPNGPHRLAARERDASGGTTTSTEVVVKVFNSAGVPLEVDGSQEFQAIDGFGVNANSAGWKDGELIPALDVLVEQQGSTLFRVIVESHEGWEETNDDADPFHFNWTYYDTLYETPKFRNAWGTIAHLNRKGVLVMLNVMGALPAWLGRTSISPAKEDEWVEMISSFLVYGVTRRGVTIDLLSPMNEEDIGFPEGPAVGPTQYVRLLKKLLVRLKALGLGGIRLAGPDTASVSGGVSSYLPLLLADAAIMAKLDHFVLHSYSGDSGGAEAAIHESGYPDRGFWMSEWAFPCAGCDTGSQISDEWGFARGTVLFLFRHLEEGAAGATVYDGYDSFYEHHGSTGYWGQLRSTPTGYAPRKRFWANAQVFRFVPPGSRRIRAAESSGRIEALAFHHAATGRVTITGYNPGQGSTTIDGLISSLPALERLELYETNASLDLERGPDVPVNGGFFSVTVAPDTLFSLTGAGTDPAPPSFIRGDANRDGRVDLSDSLDILFFLFAGREAACQDALDVDDDGSAAVTDAIGLLRFLFLGETSPPPPFPSAGLDPSSDGLGCEG